ncbi:MAG: tRNA pseudouridine(55) synthase TruB [Bacteroidetes bacterium HGW-Bacteroidetes-6]|jgi:tRNA pseudouridine55 synthase|nr:MAG: tRNA pseudouridine(55) synthase TruB [Bacteroidetes bacterium HGW-Bacteroidetes-6]
MFDFKAGEILLLNKPYTWTSFDAVRLVKTALRRQYNEKIKVGHAGTLDPLATGLLIVLTGQKTREMEFVQSQEKEYIGTFVLGATTESYDREKEVNAEYPIDHITEEAIYKVALDFTGDIMQIPPSHSAIKIDGKRAYEYARQGEDIKIKTRPVTIYSFEITRVEIPEVDFRIVCSKGTYIRSLARDFGIALNSGAYLGSLCRTRIGDNKLEDAMHPKEFTQLLGKLGDEGLLK